MPDLWQTHLMLSVDQPARKIASICCQAFDLLRLTPFCRVIGQGWYRHCDGLEGEHETGLGLP
jgi:hypothetical protein